MTPERISEIREVCAELLDAETNKRGLDNIQAPIELRYRRDRFANVAYTALPEALDEIERLRKAMKEIARFGGGASPWAQAQADIAKEVLKGTP